MKHKKIPLLDVGTLDLIRKGKVKVYPGIEQVTTDSVKFTDCREEKFDVIIPATGYLPVVNEFILDYHRVCDEDGVPLVSGKESAMRGLYFCGFNVTPTGVLREIGTEAKMIAKHIQSVSSQSISNTTESAIPPCHQSTFSYCILSQNLGRRKYQDDSQ